MARKRSESAEEAPRKVGRPPKSASGAAIAITVRIAPELVDRLRVVAAELEVSQAAIVEIGVVESEKKLARKLGRK